MENAMDTKQQARTIASVDLEGSIVKFKQWLDDPIEPQQ